MVFPPTATVPVIGRGGTLSTRVARPLRHLMHFVRSRHCGVPTHMNSPPPVLSCPPFAFRMLSQAAKRERGEFAGGSNGWHDCPRAHTAPILVTASANPGGGAKLVWLVIAS